MIQAYPRIYAWAAIVTVLIVVAASFGLASIAHAQDAAPAAPPVGIEGILAIIGNSAATGLATLLTLIVGYFSPSLPAWLRSIIERNTTEEANKWEAYVTTAANSAFAYAQAKYLSPEKIETYEQRADFLGYAINFINAHHDDIVAFADKNGNGVIDILESRLAKMAPNMPAPPVTSPADPEPVTLTQAQSLMGGPVRRGVTPKPFDDVKAMAPKLVRGKAAPHRAAMQ